MSSALRNIGGAVLIVAGLILIPFPILPGIQLVLAGVALVGKDPPVVRKGSEWLKRGLKFE